MNPCTIENFSVNVLAPSHVRKAYASYEWIPLHTGGKKLIDLKGKKNLYIKCANCGCEITASGLCPDCGNDDFYIEELMERRLVECPDLRVRITNAGFLKVDIPDSVKKSHVIKYTFDGSQPCHTSPEWKPGTKVPPNTAKVSVCLFGKGTKSAIITVNHKEKQQPPSPPKSPSENFSCSDCGATVVPSGDDARCTGCGADYHRVGGRWKQGKKQKPVTCEVCSNSVYIKSSAFTCSKCGAKHQFNSGTKKWNCLGIPHKCELCGASITLSKSKTKCPKCSAEYDISRSGSIRYKGYAVVTCKCGKVFQATSTSLSECVHCHKKYEFSKGIWNEKIEKKEEGSGCGCIIIILILFLLAWVMA